MNNNYRYVEITLEEYLALGDAGAWVMWCSSDMAPETKAVGLGVPDNERGWWSDARSRRVFVERPKLFKWFTRVKCDE